MTKVVILCGGKGTRLKPYTISIPKPLVPFKNKPILEDIISKLKKSINPNNITISLGYLSSLVSSYLESEKENLKMKFKYIEEKKPLGTVGPLTLLGGNDDVLLINGDTLSDISYNKFLTKFNIERPGILIASFDKDYVIDFGILNDNKGKLLSYAEKPVLKYKVSMGIYCIRKDIIKKIPSNKKYDIPSLIKLCLSNNIDVKVYNHKGYWYDLGRPEDFDIANSL